MENRNEEFEELPFEWQMEILRDRKMQEALMKNLDKVIDIVLSKFSKLDELKKLNDIAEAKKLCFVEAEVFGSIKPFESDDGFCKEAAKEFDFLRHLLQNEDRPIKRMQLAVDAIDALTRGDFEEADMKASIGEFDTNDEYKNIVKFWTNVAENINQ